MRINGKEKFGEQKKIEEALKADDAGRKFLRNRA